MNYFPYTYAQLVSIIVSAFLFTVLSCASVLSDPAHYDGSEDYYRQERELFTDARVALSRGDINRFRELQGLIPDYPIARYLEFEFIKRQLKASADIKDAEQVERFQKRYADQTLSNKLIRALMSSLADKKKWQDYIQISAMYPQMGDRCDLLLARVITQRQRQFDRPSRMLWTHAGTRSENCQLAFDEIEKKDPVWVSMVWKRIFGLMEKGNTAEVRKMLKYLSRSDKKPIVSWIKAYKNPAFHLEAKQNFTRDHEINRRVVLNLVKRWSKKDSESAYGFWQSARKRYSFSENQKRAVDKLIARMGAYDQVPLAHEWLHQIPDKSADRSVRNWRIRTALRRLDWPEVIKDIKALPASEIEKSQWQYWLARSHEQIGNRDKAKQIYESLAKELSYYGFLAADRLGRPYSIKDHAAASDQIKKQLAENPALIRAREYEYAGLAWVGRGEWMRTVDQFTIDETLAAAELAKDWHWADRAVFTVARTKNDKALSLRFPMPHSVEVETASANNAIDPAWIYGVMRRESGFVEDIRSSAGAVGLMQLMPATAREVARKHGRKRYGDLTSAKNNIRLGSSYLRYVLNKFDQNQILATAAYNAGPRRVKYWLPEEQNLPADVWVDTIPYTETRRYVRAVTAYTAIFQWRLHQQVTPLHQRMTEISTEILVSRR